MTKQKDITEFDLLAYVDNRLSLQRRQEVEEWLADNPEVQTKLNQDIETNRALHKAFDSVLDEPVPARLQNMLDERRSSHKFFPLRTAWQQGAVAAGIACIAALGGWKMGNHNSLENQPAHAFFALNPAQVSRVSMENGDALTAMRDTVNTQPLNWLTQKVALEIQAPDLSAHGFSLTDRRLVSVSGKEAVQLVYTDARGKKLKLFMKARWQEDAPMVHYQQHGESTTAYWEDGPLLYALNGSDLSKEVSTRLAESIRQSMNKTTTQPLVDHTAPIQADNNLKVDIVQPPKSQAIQQQPVNGSENILPGSSTNGTGRFAVPNLEQPQTAPYQVNQGM